MYQSLICVRQGSKGIKNKNLLNFHGKSLFERTLDQALNCKLISDIIISTDSVKIQKICYKKKLKEFNLRPKKLSTDTANEFDVWKYEIKKRISHQPEIYNKVKGFVVLPVTAPLREQQHISEAIKLFDRSNFDIVVAIKTASRNPYYNMVEKNKNGQLYLVKNNKLVASRQKAPDVYDLTNLIYVFNPRKILNKKHIFDCKIGSITVSKKNGIDIDDIHDFEIAKFLYENKNRKKLQL